MKCSRYRLHLKDGRRYCFQFVCQSTPRWGGGTPSQIWTGGYPIPGPVEGGGYPIQLMGGYPNLGQGVPYPADRGYSISAPGRGYAIPGPGGGEGYPIQLIGVPHPMGGGTIPGPGGEIPHLADQGVPHPRSR